MVPIVPKRRRFTLPVAAQPMLARGPITRFDRRTGTDQPGNTALAPCCATVLERMASHSVQTIVERVRQGFGISIVPMLANLRWRRDKALRGVPLPRMTVQRPWLLERRSHARERFTQALKDHFGAGAASAAARAASAHRRPRARART